eukprot:1547141-Prymnesium_polylepis.2
MRNLNRSGFPPLLTPPSPRVRAPQTDGRPLAARRSAPRRARRPPPSRARAASCAARGKPGGCTTRPMPSRAGSSRT